MIRNLDINGIIVVWNDEGENLLNKKNARYNLSFPDNVQFECETSGKLIDAIKYHINGKGKITKKIKEFKGVKVSVI